MILVIAGLISLSLELRVIIRERDALRATVYALREGDGSCAVEKKGIRLVCWMEDGAVKVMPLKTGDMIVSRDCLAKKRRAACAR
jgi:hypothetical protein